MRTPEQIKADYLEFRGRCKVLCEKAVADDPTLTIVRGHYLCPVWGREQAHWWTVRPDGTIYDPSSRQFPSDGWGDYIPFDGIVPCAECGKEMREEDVTEHEGRYAFCSVQCHGRFVGVL